MLKITRVTYLFLLSFLLPLSHLYSAASYQYRLDRGEIKLNYRHGAHEIDFVKEYAGELYADGTQVVLKYNNRHGVLTQSVVGTRMGRQITLCGGRHKVICELDFGTKYPNLRTRHGRAIRSVGIHLKMAPSMHAYRGLDDFVLPSPNQEDAGSCLFMASTGAMEIILNQHTSERALVGGPTDLSERFLMNGSETVAVENWRTDTVLNFNRLGGALSNSVYRFTKGWYETASANTLTKKEPHSVNAHYGASYNWINELTSEQLNQLQVLPQIERTLLFVDANNDQWNTGVMTPKIIQQIKNELDNKDAPVMLIYNHYAYWHAVLIVGYDDEKVSNGCPFVDSWYRYMHKKAQSLIASKELSDQKRGRRYQRYVDRVALAKDMHGGCRTQGVFKIRDSIYTGPEKPIYDYDLEKVGEETPYAKRIVEKSYNWAVYLGNHAYSIHRP